MTHQKYEELEKQFYSLQNILWKIEWAVENIQAVVWWIAWIKDVVITQQEKHKVTENRLIEIERELKVVNKAIQWINLKIAMVSWAWTVVIYFLSKL